MRQRVRVLKPEFDRVSEAGMIGSRVATSPSGVLRGRILRVSDLTAADRDAMWVLFHAYYEEVERQRFEKDLSAKHHVIVLRDTGDGSVQGFSTLERRPVEADGRRAMSIYSGDTVVAERYWGQQALQKAFYRYIFATKFLNPTLPVYWFLITKGYKTYLLLARNYLEYWPRWDVPTPAWQAALIDRLATERFEGQWRADEGVIRYDAPMGHLREHIAPVPDELADDPDIRFFVERNPGYVRGDELACIGRIDPALLLHWPMKIARRRVGKRLGISTGA